MNCPIFWFEKRNFIGDHERAEKNNSQTLPARWGRWRPVKGLNKAREWSRVLRIFPTISWTVEQSTYELAHHHGIEQSCSKSYKICCFWRGRKRNRLLVFIEKLLIHLFAWIHVVFFMLHAPCHASCKTRPAFCYFHWKESFIVGISSVRSDFFLVIYCCLPTVLKVFSFCFWLRNPWHPKCVSSRFTREYASILDLQRIC